MNPAVRRILEAVRDEGVTAGTRALARRLLEKEDGRAARAAARACTTAAVAKKAIASVVHHAKARRAEERAEEEVSRETWEACWDRSAVDHRGRLCCEACHVPRVVEPHHLEPGHGNRVDRPDRVMAICRDCHTLDPQSAHRAPRAFALRVVVPWAKQHGYTLPNRKEYRDAT